MKRETHEKHTLKQIVLLLGILMLLTGCGKKNEDGPEITFSYRPSQVDLDELEIYPYVYPWYDSEKEELTAAVRWDDGEGGFAYGTVVLRNMDTGRDGNSQWEAADGSYEEIPLPEGTAVLGCGVIVSDGWFVIVKDDAGRYTLERSADGEPLCFPLGELTGEGSFSRGRSR